MRADKRPSLGKGHATVCFHHRHQACVQSFCTATMRVSFGLVSSLLLSGVAIVSAASSWTFEDATVSITSRGAGIGGGSKDK